MARIRTIKPQHVSDKELAKICLQAHLLWILLWCFSDDEGVFENDPLLIKSNLFPRRTDIRIEQIEQWLDQLKQARFIIPFDYKNESYYIHRTFKAHQKIDRPQASKVDSTTIRRILDECSTSVREETPLYCIGEYSNVEESKARAPDLSKSNLFKQPVIPLKEEVQRNFVSRGGTVEMADVFFEKNSATGWFLRGSPITNYASLIPSFINNWKQNGSYKKTFTDSAAPGSTTSAV